MIKIKHQKNNISIYNENKIIDKYLYEVQGLIFPTYKNEKMIDKYIRENSDSNSTVYNK